MLVSAALIDHAVVAGSSPLKTVSTVVVVFVAAGWNSSWWRMIYLRLGQAAAGIWCIYMAVEVVVLTVES